ncbi:MAG: hypothetical protein AAGI38_16665 [Bacteroidota bacterium]
MRTNFRFPLLPRYFRIVGLVIVIVGIAVPLMLVETEIITIDKQILQTSQKIFILIAVMLIIFTKNKVEDEMTAKIRLEAFYMAFLFGVAFIVGEPFINLLIKGNFIIETGSFQLLVTMMVFYLVNFLFFYNKVV